jgi:predicted adenylyl cyclase CyaB
MATNIEIKAKIPDFAALQQRVEALSDTPVKVLNQEDTFFNTPQGRLKLRVLAPNLGYLIYYERPDATGPKASNYFLSKTDEPDTLKIALTNALGVRGVVRKRRLLYMVGNTRIHLDQVEGLGACLEFEVVLQDGQTPEQGEAIANDLMVQLGIQASDLVQGAYIDLLEEK